MTPRDALVPMAAIVAALGSDTALAHSGAEHALSLVAGFKHPFTGLDHILAMVSVGLWAGLNGRRALWAWPIAFVGMMLVGGALGFSGIALPTVEAGILASVVILGLLVLAAVRVQTRYGVLLVAAFALLHGHAHGAELPGNAAALTYMAGFAIATALLHAFGIGVARLAGNSGGRLAVRGAGALVAVAGIALAAV